MKICLVGQDSIIHQIDTLLKSRDYDVSYHRGDDFSFVKYFILECPAFHADLFVLFEPYNILAYAEAKRMGATVITYGTTPFMNLRGVNSYSGLINFIKDKEFYELQ